MSRNKKADIIIPTPEEDAVINAGIADDPDTDELSDEWFANAKSSAEAVPHILERYRRAIAERKSRDDETRRSLTA
ncbi:MAG: hypothetical protein F4X64_11880 [Chloroflexi bacterium]|nr:hypothetical protein [Chloroflexota bacterium]